jgi:hypothetical protein
MQKAGDIMVTETVVSANGKQKLKIIHDFYCNVLKTVYNQAASYPLIIPVAHDYRKQN